MATAEIERTTDEAPLHAKRAFLRRVRIRGYKSIAFCDVTLEPMTLLVGRNAAGKSNFLDALAFLTSVFDRGLADAIGNHGGSELIACRSTETESVAIELEADFTSGSDQYRAQFGIEIPRAVLVDPYMTERLVLTNLTTEQASPAYTVRQGKVTWSDRSANNGHVNMVIPWHRLLLSIDGFGPLDDLSSSFRRMLTYNFHPSTMRVPPVALKGWPLRRDGGNLAAAIDVLKENDRSSFDRIQKYLSHVVPEVEAFDTARAYEREFVRFSLRGGTQEAPMEFSADSMSDGTLRILGSLVAAFQSYRGHQYPTVVGIEEPETALHPAAMNALVGALNEATLRTQILLTTHSADLLDHPAIKPENVRVVQMVDGQTMIGPVDAASIEIVQRDLNTLGGLERDDRLEVDLDDLDRQRELGRSEVAPP